MKENLKKEKIFKVLSVLSFLSIVLFLVIDCVLIYVYPSIVNIIFLIIIYSLISYYEIKYQKDFFGLNSHLKHANSNRSIRSSTVIIALTSSTYTFIEHSRESIIIATGLFLFQCLIMYIGMRIFFEPFFSFPKKSKGKR